MTRAAATADTRKPVSSLGAALPGQVVLVLQGGGALGAYQAGVYQALHDAGIAPDWVIGTSIGAINGALIAGNRPEQRLSRLHDFWHRVEKSPPIAALGLGPVAQSFFGNLDTVLGGVSGFVAPKVQAWLRANARSASRPRPGTARLPCMPA